MQPSEAHSNRLARNGQCQNAVYRVSQTENISVPHSAPASDSGVTVPQSEILPPATWLNGGMAVLDPEGKILSINEALAIWLGRPAAELVGRLLPELVGERHAGAAIADDVVPG